MDHQTSSHEQSKRKLPEGLKSLLEWDRKLTKIAFDTFDKTFGYQKYYSQMKWLENSCHGIPWIVGPIAMLYLGAWPGGLELWMNLLLYIIVDIIFVAVTKAFTRRRRPNFKNDEQWFAKLDPTGTDKFSFPSGHASRAVGLTLFFTFLFPLHFIAIVPIFVWAIGVCASRLFLCRHHILDVAAGMILAYVEYLVMRLLWFDQEQAAKLFSYFGGEDPWSGA